MSDQPKYLLGYWAIRGMVQPIRYLLEYLNIPYEQTRYENNYDWYEKEFDFPNLPYLIDRQTNFRLTQSVAIFKYICKNARREDLLGRNLFEKTEIESWRGVIDDLRWACWDLIMANEYNELKMFDTLKNLIPLLTKMNNYFKERKFVNFDNLSYADFILFEGLELLNEINERFLQEEGFEYIIKYHFTIGQIPEVKRVVERNNGPHVQIDLTPSFKDKYFDKI